MKLVLGTVQFGLDYGINNSTGKPSREKAFEILKKAYHFGINELDTADAYGDSAEVVSDFIKLNTDTHFKVHSKFIADPKSDFFHAFENSCQRLGVKSLDAYYFHRFEDFKTFDQFNIVKKLKTDGRLNKLGVSLYAIDELEMALKSPYVDLIQLPFNVFDRSEEKILLLKKAKSLNKAIYVRSAFLQGLFFKNIDALPEKLKAMSEPLIALNGLCDQYGVNMEDLCLNFVASNDFIDKIVIGVDSVLQLERNVHSLNTQIPAAALRKALDIRIEHPELLNPVNWK